MIQVIKLIFILYKDNPSKYKTFLNDDLIYIGGEKLSKPAWSYVKK